MKIKITAKIKNFNLEIEDETNDLKTWRKSVIKELEYLNKDIVEKGLEEPLKCEIEQSVMIQEQEQVKLATEAQISLLHRLGVGDIQGQMTMEEANQLIRRMKQEQKWK